MEKKEKEFLNILINSTIFHGIHEDKLIPLYEKIQLVKLLPGQYLYHKGDQTNGFFLIGSGELALVDGKDDTLQEILILEHADFAGEEAFLNNPKRNNSIIAKTSCEIYYFPNSICKFLQNEYPEIKTRLIILGESRLISRKVKMPWLTESEYIQVITRKHPVILLGSILIPILLFGMIVFTSTYLIKKGVGNSNFWLILFLLIFFLMAIWLVWKVINWSNDYYIITNKRMVWVEKIAGFYDSRQEAPLSTLLSVGISKTWVGNVLGFADVIVRTFVGSIRFRNVMHAKEIGEVIEGYWQRIKTSGIKEEGEAMISAIKENLSLIAEEPSYPAVSNNELIEEDNISPVKETNFFDWLFSDFLKVRYEMGGITTYRKHWFVLIRATFFPFVLAGFSAYVLGAVLTYHLTFLSRSPAIVLSAMILLLSFMWLIYQYLDWRNDQFQLTNDQIIDVNRKPLGRESRRTAPLENILSIEYVRKGLIGIIFNFGTVYISVGSSQLTFDNVYNPSKVQQDIFSRIGLRMEEKRKINVTQERERVSEWFKVYHQQTGELIKLSREKTPQPSKDEVDPSQ